MNLTIRKTVAALVVVGALVPSLALASTSSSFTSNASTTPAQRTCMQTAVSIKSDAQITALDSLFASLRAAFVTRKNATVAAWGNADGAARVQAIVSANTAFASSVKTSWKSFRDSRHTAEASFKTAVEACGIEKASKESKKHDEKDEKKHDRVRAWGNVHLNLGLFR